MTDIIHPQIEKYAIDHSGKEPDYLTQIREFTETKVEGAQMLSGPLVGNFLKMVVRQTGATRILEIGTFTGYSALWMCQSLKPEGKLITCEFSEKHAQIARSHFDVSPYSKQIEMMVGPAIESLDRVQGPFDVVFIDADKSNYAAYYEKSLFLVRTGGSILIDNTLWSGKVLDPQDPSTISIDRLNKMIAKDNRVESVLVPIRDGVQWVIKK